MSKKRFATYIDEDLLHKIKVQAAEEKRNVTDILAEVLEKYLKEKGKK